MIKLVDASRTLLNGRIILSKRARSRRWQMRFQHEGKWIQLSTGQQHRPEADKSAENIYLEAVFKLKHQLPIQTRSFGTVAQLTINTLQAALDAGEGRSVYKDYIIALNRYLIPFFGKYNMDSIDYELLKQFDAWRSQKMGKTPTASTVGTHVSAINRVFDEGIERGYVSPQKRPHIFNRGRKGGRRADFTFAEYRMILRNIKRWCEAGRIGKTRDMRYLMWDYILLLLNTGMRHGTETANLRWQHIRIERERGKDILLFYVDGKTGGREIVARRVCQRYLRRIQERTQAIQKLSFEQLLASKIDLPVFALPDGSTTDSLRGTFRQFLKDLNILKDPRSGKVRTLYSLRHTYATFALSLAKGTDIHLLARQMGTSLLMIERHYSHLIARMRASDLVGMR